MPTSRLPFEPVTMDVHVQPFPGLHVGVNGGHNSAGRNPRGRPRQDEALQCLSQEEKECIQFFEETIDSLEDQDAEMEARQKEEQWSRSSYKFVDEHDGPKLQTLASKTADRPASSKDPEIIDLVFPPPDLVQPVQTSFNSKKPDFTKNLVRNPESHYESKPRHDVMEKNPSVYNLPAPVEDKASSGHTLYHPAGSVPTPVLIAQNIAMHQGGGGNTNVFRSSLTSIHRSQESERPPSSQDHLNKQGPPTSAKPTHYPSNISVVKASSQNHSQPVAGVNLQDRKSQMLANLPGTSYPLEEEPLHGLQAVQQKLPTRSVSFRDPTPTKSRMEALSKLGLSQSEGPSTLVRHHSTVAKPSATITSAGTQNVVRQAKPSPLTVTSDSAINTSPHDNKPLVSMTINSPPPEVSSKDYNRFGGKTIVLNPAKPAPVPAAPSPTGSLDSKAQPVSTSSAFNPYGGKSKVIAPVSPTTTRTNQFLPASSPVRVMPSPAFTSIPNKVEHMPNENNSNVRKTRTVAPSFSPPSPVTADISGSPLGFVPPRAQTQVPSPSPRPFRYINPASPNNVMGSALCPAPENRPKPTSKPSFRSQGITVQFSGRGTTDESRRDALRKLGLLKETS
ncbi:hypothetical protein UPYG_G00344400 [Umbra pygmaea]|uniref:Proline and serine rich 2 n=1 Tax=Umbra pygmaea TaxID=75934 RepID=A0ABD0VXN4_UMBPY